MLKNNSTLKRHGGKNITLYPTYLFILTLERGEGREKNIYVSEKHQSVAFCTYPDERPATRACGH